MNKIKALLEALEAAEKKSDKIDEAYEQDPENEALEAEWSAAYKAEWEAMETLRDEIVKVTGGKVDKKIAQKLIIAHRQTLKDILALGEEE